MRKGLIHIYTGDGKGKTTAAAGLALRALGSGLRVGFFQFLKPGTSGEVAPLKTLGATVCAAPASDKFTWEMDATELAACKAGQTALLEEAIAGMPGFDVLVLDEAIGAVGAGLLPPESLVRAVQNKPPALELVLTGRDAPLPLVELADYVSEMRAVKHPFETGQPARRGIEF